MSDVKETIGIVGLGRMGRAMAERLAGVGFAVAGWNRSPLVPEDDSGVPVLLDLADLLARADILVLSLFDDAAVTEVLEKILGTNVDLTGKLVVDTSTVGPEVLRAVADRFAARGAALVDSPISGGPDMIRAGKAGLYLGGSEADVARFRPVAEVLGQRVLTIGPLGAGATAKILNNMMLVSYWQILKETVLVGKAAGLDPHQVLRLIAGSPGATPAMQSRLPVLLGESDAVGFTLSGAAKDGTVARRLAEALAIDTPALAAGLKSFLDAEARGMGEVDLATMVRDAYTSATD